MQSTRPGTTRSHSANASRRYSGLKASDLSGVNKENTEVEKRGGYNAATGQMEGAPPKRLSGDKRTSSHPDTPTADQPQDQKRSKKVYTPHQSREQGHYHVVLGESLQGTPEKHRWKILDLIGEGTFAKVVEVWDRKRKVYVAVKLVRAVEKYVRDAKFEINMLHKIREDDVQDFYPTIKYRSYFFAESNAGEHMCIVFPKLGFCLLDYLTRCATFKMHEVAHIAWQMGAALNYLHAHLRLIHTDLKPENILLEKPCEVIDKVGNRTYNLPACTRIRIIDFGGATDERHSKHSIVSTRHYRAPEVILSQGWMFGADMWSTGCILLELHTGRLLFDTHDNREHLAMMEKVLGRMPSFYPDACTGQQAQPFFDRHGRLDTAWLAGSDADALKSKAKINRLVALTNMPLDADFIDLISRLLDFNKTTRLRAHEVMYHPFVWKNYPESRRENEAREQYEQQCFKEILGGPSSRTRVVEPAYDRRGGYSSASVRP